MAAQPVEWVLVVYYGTSAHRATYGRLNNTKYTKDYIQLSRKTEFLEAIKRLFPVTTGTKGNVPLSYQWPTGKTQGSLVFNSADRPHLKWETSLGAPKAWRMSLSPSETTAETILGDPTRTDFQDAEQELALLASRGVGQPYLMAVKLHNESTTLHLRAYLDGAKKRYAWADLGIVPPSIKALASKTTQKSAIAWETIASGGVLPTPDVADILSRLDASGTSDKIFAENLKFDTAREVALYLRRPAYGLFFDPSKNHDAWITPTSLSEELAIATPDFLKIIEAKYPAQDQGDFAAEAADADADEVQAFSVKIESKDYSVADSTATVKTRGSAQKAFANAVKSNYRNSCAITGINTIEFLVASHIVPWSVDASIRLDPSNGICLSLLMDRAFEKGHLLIEDDFSIKVNWEKVGGDAVLKKLLQPYDGMKMSEPAAHPPEVSYLQRRRNIVCSS